MFAAQLKNELWKLAAKQRTYIGFVVFVTAQVLMLLMFRHTRWQNDFERLLGLNGYLAADYLSALTVGLIMLAPQLGLLLPLYVALIGGDMIAKEAEDGTLRMILSRPISRFRLLVVKWLAGIVFTAVLVVALGTISVVFARLTFPWKGLFVFMQDPLSGNRTFGLFEPGEGLALYAVSQIFVAINTTALLSLALMFSCFNMKPATATILTLSCVFVSTVLEHIPFFERYQRWFITYHLASWTWVFQKPTSWPQIMQSEIVLAAVAVSAFLVGAAGFHSRDIKS